MSDTTTIPIKKSTRDELKKLGRKGETYDTILQKLIQLAEKEDFFREHLKILEEEEFTPLDEL
jgi:alpha/beta superfamily hydrolase